MDSVIRNKDLSWIIQILLSDDVLVENLKTKFYHALRVGNDELMETPGESELNNEEFIHVCLQKWKMNQGKLAKLKSLISILREENFEDTADKIIETIKKSNEIINDEDMVDDDKDDYDYNPNYKIPNRLPHDHTIWFDVYEPVHTFTGREKDIENIHKLITSSSNSNSENYKNSNSLLSTVTVVHGMGGIGKSNIGRKLSHDYWSEYDSNIIWIDGSTVSTIETCFKRFARKIKIFVSDSKGLEEILDEIYEYFSTCKSLFIFDNVSKFYNCVDFFLPKNLQPNQQKPYFLILTRKFNLIPNLMTKTYSLDLFTEQEATTFIITELKLKKKSDFKLAHDLSKRLQYFPLALQQGIASLKHLQRMEEMLGKSTNPLIKYIRLLEDKKIQTLGYHFYRDTGDEYSNNLLTVFIEDFTSVANTPLYGDNAMDILNALSYFEYENNIHASIFKNYYDSTEINESLEILKQHSLIKTSMDPIDGGVTITIHRLLQEILRVRNKDNEVEVMRKTFNIIRNCKIWTYMSHIRSLWKYAGLNHDEIIIEFPKFGILLCENYNPDWFLHLKENLDKYKNVFGQNHKYVLSMLCTGIKNIGDEPEEKIEFDYILKLGGELGKIMEEYLLAAGAGDKNIKDIITKYKINEVADHLIFLSEKNEGKNRKLLYEKVLCVYKCIYEVMKQNGSWANIIMGAKGLIKCLIKFEKIEEILKCSQEIQQLIVSTTTNSNDDDDHPDPIQCYLLNDFIKVLFMCGVSSSTKILKFELFENILKFLQKISYIQLKLQNNGINMTTIQNIDDELKMIITCHLILGNEENLEQIFVTYEKQNKFNEMLDILDSITAMLKEQKNFTGVLKSLQFKQAKLQIMCPTSEFIELHLCQTKIEIDEILIILKKLEDEEMAAAAEIVAATARAKAEAEASAQRAIEREEWLKKLASSPRPSPSPSEENKYMRSSLYGHEERLNRIRRFEYQMFNHRGKNGFLGRRRFEKDMEDLVDRVNFEEEEGEGMGHMRRMILLKHGRFGLNDFENSMRHEENKELLLHKYMIDMKNMRRFRRDTESSDSD